MCLSYPTRHAAASMRPPQNAGEDGVSGGLSDANWHRFNEAPAERGGRRPPMGAAWTFHTSFNEAPAERGGRRHAVSVAKREHVLLQ